MLGILFMSTVSCREFILKSVLLAEGHVPRVISYVQKSIPWVALLMFCPCFARRLPFVAQWRILCLVFCFYRMLYKQWETRAPPWRELLESWLHQLSLRPSRAGRTRKQLCFLGVQIALHIPGHDSRIFISLNRCNRFPPNWKHHLRSSLTGHPATPYPRYLDHPSKSSSRFILNIFNCIRSYWKYFLIAY